MLRENFVNATRAYGSFTEDGDPTNVNKLYDKIIVLKSEMRNAPDKGQSLLIQLIDFFDPWVRMWSASFLLDIDEQIAVEELERLSVLGGFVAFDAEMILKEWRTGRLKIT